MSAELTLNDRLGRAVCESQQISHTAEVIAAAIAAYASRHSIPCRDVGVFVVCCDDIDVFA